MTRSYADSFTKRWLLGLVMLAGVVAIVATWWMTGQRRGDNVVIIIIDTLRADSLGCYGFQQPTSPNIDALASESILFEQAVSCAPTTLPSVTAMMTSTYPVANNVRYNGGFRVSDSSITLAEILQQAGYKTAAFIGGYPLVSNRNLDQGFDVYDDDISASSKECGERVKNPAQEPLERTAFDVNERAFEWLDKVKNDRFFLVVHYYDVHWPYEPCSPYDEKFEHPYLGEIAYTDEQTGKLLDKIRDLGLGNNTLIVLTSDHGESLGAHQEITHGEHIFDATVKIPLIMHHRKRIPKGRRIGTMVRNIDIMPTILDFLDIPGSPHSQGSSLLAALSGELKENPILLETMLLFYKGKKRGIPPTTTMGLRTSEWKLVSLTWEEDGIPGRSDALYDLTRDPLETFNVIDENPDVSSRMLDEMQQMIQAYSNQDVPKGHRIEMDDKTRKNLKSLGYLN